MALRASLAPATQSLFTRVGIDRVNGLLTLGVNARHIFPHTKRIFKKW